MEEKKEINKEELYARVDKVRECFKTIVELGDKGSIDERAFVYFFIALGMDDLNDRIGEFGKLLREEKGINEGEEYAKENGLS